MWIVVNLILMAVFAFYVHVNYFIGLVSIMVFRHKPPARKAKLPSVSVIIATKNEESVIEETLKRIRNSDYPEDKLEIIVVDSSTDSTAEIAKKYGARVVKDRNGKGKPAALNLAIHKEKGELLYFLDADSWVEKDTIKNIVSG